MIKHFIVLYFCCLHLLSSMAQPNKISTTMFTVINVKLFPKLKILTWDTINTSKAYYTIDSVDSKNTTLNIIISNKAFTDNDIKGNSFNLSCSTQIQIFKIELKNKSGEAIKTGNYKYDGSDTKPLNGLPKIELIAKPTIEIITNLKTMKNIFDYSKEHTCKIIELNENYIYGEFLFKDTEGLISGQFKAKIIK
jgi:hypothetical protein